MNALTCLLSCHPFAVSNVRGYLTVKCHSPFQRYPGHTCGDIFQEHTILYLQLFHHLCSLRLRLKSINLYSCLTQLGYSLTSHQRIRIHKTYYHTSYLSFYYSLRTRGLISLMATWLKGNIHRSTSAVNTFLVSILESHALCMQVTILHMVAGGDDIIISYDESTNEGIGIYCSLTLLGNYHRLMN